jgi:hypothetical protein
VSGRQTRSIVLASTRNSVPSEAAAEYSSGKFASCFATATNLLLEAAADRFPTEGST